MMRDVTVNVSVVVTKGFGTNNMVQVRVIGCNTK